MSKQTDLINIPDAITVSGSNVGIGTSAPATALHVRGTASTAGATRSVVTLTDDTAMGINVGSGVAFRGLYTSAGAEANYGGIFAGKSNANSGNANGYLSLSYSASGTLTEGIRISETGKVGIGTTNPTVAAGTGLVINGGTNQARLALKNDATGDGSGDGFQIVVTSGSGSNGGQAIFEQRENNIIAFKTNSSETMRIDSSGNLLVGKTSSSTTTAGNELRAGGLAAFTRSGSYSLNLNRLSSDGDIAVFQKDGTTVGSIGVLGNNNLTISGTQFNHCGLSFATNAILPTTESVTNNNTVDMGANGNAYKDLYLGGGVYLGGTGSANKLDDYEEGTWTPSIVGSSSESGQNYANQNGDYTKIGNVVHCRFAITMLASGNFNGYLLLNGMPFNIEATPNTVHLGSVYFVNAGQNIITLGLQSIENDNKAYLWVKTVASASREYPSHSLITNNLEITGSFTYPTAS